MGKPNSDQKIVLITGGNGGIGKAISYEYKRAGYFVIVADKEGDGLHDAYFKSDLSYPENVEKLMTDIFERFIDIDIIINNVGIGSGKTLTEITTEDFLKVMNTNLTCAFITSRELAKKRLTNKSKYGRIINISSTRYLMCEKNNEPYSASKGGIVSLTRALAISLSEYNITVNCISPGWIENVNYSNLTEEDHCQHPSGRVGKPTDIARACLFLSDPDNDFINGENIVIDGGMTRKMIYV